MITVRRKPMTMPGMFNTLDDLWLRNWPADNTQNFRPAVNIAEYDKHFQLDFSAPGFEKSDFKIEMEKDQLSVSVEREVSAENTKDNFTRKEFTISNFKRMFTLPELVDTDKIEARYENGLLHVFLPKKENMVVNNKKVIDIK